MGLVLVTPPDAEPLELPEAKVHLRIGEDVTAEDDLVRDLIISAREEVEAFLQRPLITQTWRLTLDRFPCGPILLPRPPLQEVTSVVYIDTAGVQQTLEAAAYVVDTASLPGKIDLAYSYSWPSTRDQPNAVTVLFEAGYGDAAAVPSRARSAMKLIIGELYEHRERVVTGTIVNELPAAERLLWPLRYLELS